ncbi:MAG: hypothetical protein AAGA66_00840 [Bacteroidota bacterium]
MLLEKNELPSWFEYPSEFLILIDQNLLDFDPWIVITGDRLKTRYQGLKERYPNRELIPFAKREDNDDLACFEEGKEVVIIHDFASSGFEGGQESILFWDWLKQTVDDMIEYNS